MHCVALGVKIGRVRMYPHAGRHSVSTCLGHPHSDYGAQTVAAGDMRTRSVTFSAECCASQLKMEKM